MPKDEEQLRLLVQNAQDYAIFILDARGRIVSQNTGAERILGHSDADIVGRPFAFLFLPEDRAAGIPEWELQTARTQGQAENRRWHVRRDGTRFFAEGSLAALREGDGGLRGFGLVMRDVTERRRLDEALQLSEERLRFAVEGAGVGTWLWDLATGARIWSDTSKALFGLPADAEVTEDGFVALLHPEDQARWRRVTAAALEDGAGYDVEYRVAQPDGAVRWIHAKGRPFLGHDGRPVRLEGIMQDVTARKWSEERAAEALREQSRIAETLQRSMLQAAPRGRFPGLAVETLYEAALDEAEIGGDFFDAFLCDENRVALVVGDVSGKGLLAASRTAEVKYALRAFLHAYGSPGPALAALNDFLCETQHRDGDDGGTFIALLLAVADLAQGRAVFAVAGAEPALILRPEGIAEITAPPGRPLGIAPGGDYAESSERFAPGDTILMATDGITEARRADEFLGSGGLASLAEGIGASAPLGDLARGIHAGAEQFAGGSLRDDACLLLARRLPAS